MAPPPLYPPVAPSSDYCYVVKVSTQQATATDGKTGQINNLCCCILRVQ